MKSKVKVNEKSSGMRILEGLEKGSILYTNLVSTSKSGMTHKIKVLVAGQDDRYDDETKSYKQRMTITSVHIPEFSAYRPTEGCFKVTGCGMDMGFSVVYDLGMAIHNDGYYFRHEWI